MNRVRPVVLCILDGVGLGLGEEDDAWATAPTPNLDRWKAERPWIPLQAHGRAVGLPSDGDMGNSEVGHNALGAGRVFDQGAKLVEGALASGALFEGPHWSELMRRDCVHFLGLLSDGNVHSHVDHLHQMIARAAQDGMKRIRVHVLTDGRDVSARSALEWVEPLERSLAAHREAGRDYRIASGGGRMHMTMDRYEADWAMVQRGWACHVHGTGRPFPSASDAIRTLYAEDAEVDDQWLPAFVITGEDGQPVGPIEDGHGVIFFNFRGDRAIEISRAFEDSGLSTFDRGRVPDTYFVGMMEYDGDLKVPQNYLVAPPAIDRTVGEALVRAGRRSWVCSETQKYGHVTFFFNGNRSGMIDEGREQYVEIPSDDLPFDERPWMKAAEITDQAVRAIHSQRWDHVRLNIANGDMVGHTGDLEATRVAMAAVDLCVGRLWKAVRAVDGVLLVTADHGNAEEMVQRKKGRILTDTQGEPLVRTSHSLNPVPFFVLDDRGTWGFTEQASGGSIARVGTTLLQMLDADVPDGYLPSLLQRKR